jgi:hypothetical protein
LLRDAEQVIDDDGEGGYAGPEGWWRPVDDVEAVLTRVVALPEEDGVARETSSSSQAVAAEVDDVVMHRARESQWRCLGGRW